MLPLNEVLSQPDPLDAVAVYARPEALVGNTGALSALTARGATTLVVDGSVPADIARSGLPQGLVVIEAIARAGWHVAGHRLILEEQRDFPGGDTGAVQRRKRKGDKIAGRQCRHIGSDGVWED